ncbi:dynein regulatory complex subunit 3 [Denticeps clupeoides]|uniref:dynein regulatory complex subunit 3 n=1 Tax=Denticeps clupeoides TaxID=299321 RepID=UPI0010A40CA7|nr:dynein regulatory complex subunit 3 [Denticeps clupeoides]XP_028843462.1 dynein regulatory complex subunit 3 [Denticeps clupeoides]XP_028843463.1 dynein regulatory complex subunit 3 [Denticeps clupeoides]
MSNSSLVPQVLDDKLLKRAAEEQLTETGRRLCRKEGMELQQVLKLQLHFLNILKIENLWQFTSLTKLSLSGNVIEKIEGLDSLVGLKWLDLSFNNIKAIEGVDTLVNLQDLSLHNNHISVIENLDTLQNMQFLSMGNNFLSQFSNVMYLRRCNSLYGLNLAGNPLCNEENYKIFVVAHLPNLVYLDHKLVDEQTRKMSSLRYQYDIEKLGLSETDALEQKKKDDEELQIHWDAFVEHLNGPQLFDSMCADDPDAHKLTHLSAVAALLDSYKSQQATLCIQIFKNGLAQHQRRESEVNLFISSLQVALAKNQEKASWGVTNFRKKQLPQIMAEIRHRSKMLEAFKEDINHLQHTLMTLELELVVQLEDIMTIFEKSISDLVTTFINDVKDVFSQCRDLENQHYNKILEISMATLKKIARNELKEDLPIDVRMLFVDKETLTNILKSSHDIHILKINNREDELVTRVNTWKSLLMMSIHDKEVTRNRTRILEIKNFRAHIWSQMEKAYFSKLQ